MQWQFAVPLLALSCVFLMFLTSEMLIDSQIQQTQHTYPQFAAQVLVEVYGLSMRELLLPPKHPPQTKAYFFAISQLIFIIFKLRIMDNDPNPNNPQDVVQIAQNLLALALDEADATDQPQLHVFLTACYQTNILANGGMLNSIQINRFNAFIYRICMNYPQTQGANKIIQYSLMAFLANQQTFREIDFQDERALHSITRRTCQLMITFIRKGFYQSTFTFLKFLVMDKKPPYLSIQEFTQQLKYETQSLNLVLSFQDEKQALIGMNQISLNLDNNMVDVIICLLEINDIYFKLFHRLNCRREVLWLFRKHMDKKNYKQPEATFILLFVTKDQDLEKFTIIFDVLQQNYFNYEATKKILQSLIKREENISLYSKIRLYNENFKEMFLQLLNKHWANKNHQLLIDTFLSINDASNLVIVYLLVNLQSHFPKKYLTLLFKQERILYKHAIVIAITLAKNNSDQHLSHELMQLYQKYEAQFNFQRKGLFLRALHYSLCQNKKQVYWYIMTRIQASQLDSLANFGFFPLGQLREDRITPQDRNKLERILNKIGENNEKKAFIQLSMFCNDKSPSFQKISKLEKIVKLPSSDLLHQILRQYELSGPEVASCMVMIINNDPFFSSNCNEIIIQETLTIYQRFLEIFREKLAKYLKEQANSKRISYYEALFKYGLHIEQEIVRDLDDPIEYVLSGKYSYNRVTGTDFVDYFAQLQDNSEEIGSLLSIKKIIIQLRLILKYAYNNGNGNNTLSKFKLQSLFDKEYAHLYSFAVLKAYYQLDIPDRSVLRKIISTFEPQYAFFAEVERKFIYLNQECIDILQYFPLLLEQINSEAMVFLSNLVQSEQTKRYKSVERERMSQREIQQIVKDADSNQEYLIFSNQNLIRSIKRHHLSILLTAETSLSLQSIPKVLNQLVKLQGFSEQIQPMIKVWISHIEYFGIQFFEPFDEWLNKVDSYCNLWKWFLVDKLYQFNMEIIDKHFHNLTQCLKILYAQPKLYPANEENILLTLLIIHQTRLPLNQAIRRIPADEITDVFLKNRLPGPIQKNSYQCYTCDITICGDCLSLFHKNHDFSCDKTKQICSQRDKHQQKTKNVFESKFSKEDEQESNFKTLSQMLKNVQVRMQPERQLKNNGMKEQQSPSIEQERNNQHELLHFEPQRNDEMNDPLQFKSTSEKSIENISQNRIINQPFTPQFFPLPMRQIQLKINGEPLQSLLSKELYRRVNTQIIQISGQFKVKLIPANLRYNFFFQSQNFKNKRAWADQDKNLVLRNHPTSTRLTSNGIFLAYAKNFAFGSQISFYSLNKITQRMEIRLKIQLYIHAQKEEYFRQSVLNLDYKPEIQQLIFNKQRKNLIAIIFKQSVSIIMIKRSGNLKKYIPVMPEGDLPIIKFQWILGKKHRVAFAFATNEQIYVGHLSDRNESKLVNSTIKVLTNIRDFVAIRKFGLTFFYVIDKEGNLFKSKFDPQQKPTTYVPHKKVTFFQKLLPFQTLIFNENMLFISAQGGKFYQFEADERHTSLNLVRIFDLGKILKQNTYLACQLSTYIFTQLHIIDSTEQSTIIGSILRLKNQEIKKEGGYFYIIRINMNDTIEVMLLQEFGSFDTYEAIPFKENRYIIPAVDHCGTFSCFQYSISKIEPLFLISENSIIACGLTLIRNRILENTKYYDPTRCINFCKMRELNSYFNIHINEQHVSVQKHHTQSKRYFFTGFLLDVVNTTAMGEISFVFLDQQYRFNVKRKRSISIPLNIKETLTLFANGEEFLLNFQKNNVIVLGFKLFGHFYKDDNVYKRAFLEFHKLVMTRSIYYSDDILHFLQNDERDDIKQLMILDYRNLKQSHHYTNEELNLLLKIELYREMLSSSINEDQIEEAINFVQCDLIPICSKRHFLINSCKKLMRKMCGMMISSTGGVIGHPFEYRTVLDFYHFSEYYYKWQNNHQIVPFEKLINFLFGLIFKRIGNLYLILKYYPNLIDKLNTYLKTLLKPRSEFNDDSQLQAHKQRLSSIYPCFIILISEYYQTIKNKTDNDRMIDESHEKQPERQIINSLNVIFDKSNMEIYRSLFLNALTSLEQLHLTTKDSQRLTTKIDIFALDQENSSIDSKEYADSIRSSSNEDRFQNIQSGQRQSQEQQGPFAPEQMREMNEGSSGESINSISNERACINDQFKNMQDFFKYGDLLTNNPVLFTYYQFNFSMAIGLFEAQYIDPGNKTFSILFFFNLLKNIEANLVPNRDQEYLNQFFQQIISDIGNPLQSTLYMILNYFFEPQYRVTMEGNRSMYPSKSKISQQFIEYIYLHGISAEKLLLQIVINTPEKITSLKQVLELSEFPITNNLYQLKFVGFVYLNARIIKGIHPIRNQVFKSIILAAAFQHKLRIWKNIIHFENWQNQLNGIQAGFEMLSRKRQEAIELIYVGSQQVPADLIKNINQNQENLQKLNDMLDLPSSDTHKILEILNVYYSSE